MRAGSAWASTCTGSPTRTSATTKCGRATCARKYDVILYPSAPRADRRAAGAGAAGRHAAAVQADGRDAQRSRPRRIRPTTAAAASAVTACRSSQKFVEAGGVLITEGQTTQALVEYRMAPGVTVEDDERPLRAGIGHQDAARRQDEPDSLRLRPERARGADQERAGAERRWRQAGDLADLAAGAVAAADVAAFRKAWAAAICSRCPRPRS